MEMTEQRECKHTDAIEPYMSATVSAMAIDFKVWGFKCNICDKRWDIGNATDAIEAAERLSAEVAIQNIIIYGEGGFVTDQFLDALRAYANILEG